MVDTLEDMGNCVKITTPYTTALIPAVNIQVEGVPGYIDGDWYGVYFEVLFEDGTLWVISQGAETEVPGIILTMYNNWHIHDENDVDLWNDAPDHGAILRDWDEFVLWYRLELTHILQKGEWGMDRNLREMVGV